MKFLEVKGIMYNLNKFMTISKQDVSKYVKTAEDGAPYIIYMSTGTSIFKGDVVKLEFNSFEQWVTVWNEIRELTK